jgi:tetratricopeptide (TPR) repeat protein
VGLWNELGAKREREATNLLFEAQTAARKAVSEKKFEEAERAYQPLLEKFKGTRAAYEAELQMGDLWMDAGNFEKANGHYQSASSMTSDSFSRLLANYSLGVAKESEGKYSEAIASYSAALDAQGSDFIRPEILMAQARCYEALKDVKRAIEIYKTVQEKYSSRAYYSGAASAYEKQLSAGAQ